MFTHLLDMVPQGLCERTGRAGPSWGPETQVHGVASRGQGFPEHFRFQQLKRSRWAHPLLLRFGFILQLWKFLKETVSSTLPLEWQTEFLESPQDFLPHPHHGMHTPQKPWD